MSYTPKTTAQESAAILKEQITGKNVIITGVSPSSIGEENLRVLAPYAKTIIVASRSKERATQATTRTLKETPSANIKVVLLDLTSKASIQAAASEILALDIPIHVLVNNAGVAQPLTLTRTADGFESQFGGNHLGHFLFTSLIFPALLRGASPSTPARIVNVSSVAANWGGEIRFDDPNFELRPEEYGRYPAYAQSKTANMLFSKGLAKRYGSNGIESFSLSPGAIRETGMGSSVPIKDLIAFGVLKEDGTPVADDVFKTIENGTSTQIVAGFEPSLSAHNGAFLDDSAVHDERAPAFGTSEENADKLWELSEKLWNVKFGA